MAKFLNLIQDLDYKKSTIFKIGWKRGFNLLKTDEDKSLLHKIKKHIYFLIFKSSTIPSMRSLNSSSLTSPLKSLKLV